MVFVGDGEVEGFHGVPGDGVGGEGEHSTVEGGRSAQVVENDGAVGGGGGEDGGFGLVEGDGGDGFDRRWPAEGLGRSCGGPRDVVDGYGAAGGSEGRERAVVRDASKCGLSEPGCCWSASGWCVVWIEELYCPVTPAREESLVSCPTHPFYDVFVCSTVPYLFLTGEVPDFDHAVTAAAGEVFKAI